MKKYDDDHEIRAPRVNLAVQPSLMGDGHNIFHTGEGLIDSWTVVNQKKYACQYLANKKKKRQN